MLFSPFSCHILRLRFKYCAQYPIHIQPVCPLMKLSGQVGETVIIPQEINSLRILFCPEFVTNSTSRCVKLFLYDVWLSG
jgi:hypothetical protein